MAKAGLKLDMAQVDRQFEADKAQIKKRAKQVKLNENEDLTYRFRESLRIWEAFLKNKKAEAWANAFYCLHLYLRIVLEKRLHVVKRKGFEEQAQLALKRLNMLERQLELCSRGMRYEVMVKQQNAILNNMRRMEREQKEAQAKAAEQKERMEAERIKQVKEKEEQEKKKAAALAAAMASGELEEEEMDKLLDDEEEKEIQMEKQPEQMETKQPEGGSQEQTLYPNLDSRREELEEQIRKEKESLQNLNSVSTQEPAQQRGEVPNTRGGTAAPPTQKQKAMRFRVQRVPGDGNCAFRSLMQGMSGGKLGSGEEGKQAKNLRELTVRLLWEMRDVEVTGTGLTVEQVILMDDDPSYSTFAEYLTLMRNSKYAGSTELWVLSKHFKRTIKVWIQEGSGFREIVTYGEGLSTPANLLWRKGGGRDGNHYDVLIPV